VSTEERSVFRRDNHAPKITQVIAEVEWRSYFLATVDVPNP
jgi:hypothetical protein